MRSLTVLERTRSAEQPNGWLQRCGRGGALASTSKTSPLWTSESAHGQSGRRIPRSAWVNLTQGIDVGSAPYTVREYFPLIENPTWRGVSARVQRLGESLLSVRADRLIPAAVLPFRRLTTPCES